MHMRCAGQIEAPSSSIRTRPRVDVEFEMLTPEIVGDVHISVDVPSSHEGVAGHGGSPSRLVRTREVVAHTGGRFSSQHTAVGCAPLEYHRARRAGHADSDSAGRDFNE